MYYQNPYQFQQTGIIWVSSEQEAQMYPIAPNNAVTLWERNGKAVYLKSADATGRPMMKAYDLTERVPAQQGVLSEYATKNDLAALNDAIEALREELKGEQK